ncbi:UNVERIFIED_CONTAM: hypothetical protein FKN15_065111 [Acipenser sinensis]
MPPCASYWQNHSVSTQTRLREACLLERTNRPCMVMQKLSPKIHQDAVTQPVPNPMAYYMHRSPWWFHSFETLFNHVIELIVPFFIFMGRRMCAVNGLLQILFQVVLIVSGNLSFLNWLTIVPSIACFDDASLGFLFRSGQGGVKHQVVLIVSGNLSFLNWLTIVPSIACFDDASLGFLFRSGQGGVKHQVFVLHTVQYDLHCGPHAYLQTMKDTNNVRVKKTNSGMQIRRVANISLGLLIVCLSMPVVLNLVSSQQIMNTSFNPLRIVNTYGAFGRYRALGSSFSFTNNLSIL